MISLIICICCLCPHLICTIEHTIIIYQIVNTFHTPESQVMDFLIQYIIEEFGCFIRIFTACCNRYGYAAGLVQCITICMPLILHTFVNSQTKRYIVTSLKIQSLLFEYIIYCICKIPPLVAHTKYTSCRKLGDILIINLGCKFCIDHALLIFFVELLEISPGSICCVVIHNLHIVGIYDNGTIIWIAIQELSCILNTEVSPVITQHGIRNICCSVFHCRIGCCIVF